MTEVRFERVLLCSATWNGFSKLLWLFSCLLTAVFLVNVWTNCGLEPCQGCHLSAPVENQNKIPAILSDFDGETTDEIGFKMCTAREFNAPWFTAAMALVGETPKCHRKQWELGYLVHTIKINNLCTKGKRGLVFAVGLEHMPNLFADMGCDIVATDLPRSDDPQFVEAWDRTGQHSSSLKNLYYAGYKDITFEDFSKRVVFREENMNTYSEWLQQQKFDFVWSLCSVEHVGSIELGQRAIIRSTDLLNPGGIAFHTIEFNLVSNEATKQLEIESIWRKRDIEKLKQMAVEKGLEIPSVQWGAGKRYLDRNPDGLNGEYLSYDHVKLFENWTREGLEKGLIKTSFATVIRKPLIIGGNTN